MSEERQKSEEPPVGLHAADQVGPSRSFDRFARLTLTISFGIIGGLGSWLIYNRWCGVSMQMAVGRCAAFVGFMAFVHWIGYFLWRRQFVRCPNGGEKLRSPISSEYRPAIKTVLLQQAVVLILAALVLDGGVTFNSAVISVVGFWLGLGVILVRRPDSPTPGDLFYVGYAFLLIAAIVIVSEPIVVAALIGR